MTEYFRITGKNTIQFDAGPTGNYLFTQGKPPRKLSTVLTRREVLALLPRLPLGIRPLALQHGLSVVTMEFNIHGVSDTDMEDKEHDLIETLVEAELYASSLGDMGTRAVLTVKSDGAVATSYKSMFYGFIDELDARDVLGAIIKGHSLEGLRLVLYCEPYWRPDSAIELGPNEIQTPSFEEDGNGDGLADHWVAVGTPTTTIETTKVLHGCDSQKVVTDNNSLEGIETGNISDAVATSAVAYAWVARDDPGDDIAVEIWDTVGSVVIDTALLSTGGWETEVAGGVTWSRLVVSSNALVATRNYTLRIVRRLADATQITTFYVDETFWLFGTTTALDEWIGYGVIYNHYDPTEDYPNHIDHLNYLDLGRLKGDVDSRLRIEIESLYSNTYGPSEFTVARRTDPCLPCQLRWYLGAEFATTQVNWADHLDAARSGGDVVRDAANTAGHVIWNLLTLGYNLACQKGRFRILGVVYADYDGDADENIKFRATAGIAASPYQQSAWLQPLIADTWHWLDFGVFEMTGQFWGNELPSTFYWRVDYEKEAADAVELDFVLILPEDESILRILLGDHYLSLNEDVLWDNTCDFIHAMKRNAADAFMWHPPIQAEPLALRPDEQNRLIFAIGHYMSSAFPYKGCLVHEDNGEHMLVSLKYLPQFVSPLE